MKRFWEYQFFSEWFHRESPCQGAALAGKRLIVTIVANMAHRCIQGYCGIGGYCGIQLRYSMEHSPRWDDVIYNATILGKAKKIV